VDIRSDAPAIRYANALEILLKDKVTDGILVINSPYAVASGKEVAMAVIDDAPARRNLDGALLLALRALREVAVMDYLEISQPQSNHADPQDQDAAKHVKTPCAVAR
jgi:acyl-CoA synthetase (NDP forming)